MAARFATVGEVIALATAVLTATCCCGVRLCHDGWTVAVAAARAPAPACAPEGAVDGAVIVGLIAVRACPAALPEICGVAWPVAGARGATACGAAICGRA